MYFEQKKQRKNWKESATITENDEYIRECNNNNSIYNTGAGTGTAKVYSGEKRDETENTHTHNI